MKRVIVFVVGIVLLGLTGSVWAGDTLLKTLQNKGVLTEAEVSAILAEQEAEGKTALPKALKGLSVGGQVYMEYSAGDKNYDGTDFNKFSLTRGYINIRKEINPWFKLRVTPDITQLATGDNAGDFELRMKYYYADILLQDYSFLTDNDLRIGLAQIPYLEFLEGTNIYRMQGTMFQERFGNFNSADVGIGLLGNFGGKLSKELQERVGYPTPYAGRYGGYHIGLYDGGGYHATEENQNKVLEWRFTLRPVPDSTPGLQMTLFGLTGKGNTAASTQWNSNTLHLSYQNRYTVLTGEYMEGKGRQDGANENDNKGYSVFGDFKLAVYDRLSLMIRYDVWDPNTDSGADEETLFIGGIGTKITANNSILVAYEQRHKDFTQDDDKKGQVVFQINF